MTPQSERAVARRIAAIVTMRFQCLICCQERRQRPDPRASHGYCARHTPHPVKIAGRWEITYGGDAA